MWPPHCPVSAQTWESVFLRNSWRVIVLTCEAHFFDWPLPLSPQARIFYQSGCSGSQCWGWKPKLSTTVWTSCVMIRILLLQTLGLGYNFNFLLLCSLSASYLPSVLKSWLTELGLVALCLLCPAGPSSKARCWATNGIEVDFSESLLRAPVNAGRYRVL